MASLSAVLPHRAQHDRPVAAGEDLDALVDFFQHLSPASLVQIERFYAHEAWFKDPFNEVCGVEAIRRIFEHMFRQVHDPRFVVTERIAGENGVMLAWDFHFRMRTWRPATVQTVHGVSHLRFDGEGRVSFHRDYWDAAEELYAKLPVLGWAMRGLQRALRA
jgi:ketosteroid isomerase-like protein